MISDSEGVPVEAGFSMPAEWAPHIGCFISWPCREETWHGHIIRARSAYKGVIEAVNAFEPVTVLTDPPSAENARAMLGDGIEVLEVELDDSWVRDNGPVFVTSSNGEEALVRFRFNGWGGKSPSTKDGLVPRFLANHLKVRMFEAPMVLEGGAFSVDGRGTLLTTEQCLLNQNRNPELRREEIEKILSEYLGIRKVIWLLEGVLDDMTDGHVDGVAAFAKERLVLASHTEDESNPNFAPLARNMERLNSATDASGSSIEIVRIVQPRPSRVEGLPVTACYTNHYVANGGVVVPLYSLAEDREALETLETVYDGREVVGVDARYIEIGGGAVHCITQQRPAAGSARQ